MAHNKSYRTRFAVADQIVCRVARYYSYLSVVTVLVMGLLSTGDVIAGKLFGSALPITNDIVKYFMIPTCFCLLGTVQLNGGLMQVDLFSRKYSAQMRKVFSVISGILGTAIFSFAGWQTFRLLISHITKREMSAASTYAFPLWPLTLICVLSLFLLAFSFVWVMLRLFLLPEQADPANPASGGTE